MTPDQSGPAIAVAETAPPGDAPATPTASMRRVGIASMIGTMVEFYDFNIYGVAAAVVFPRVFFPALGPAAGTVAAFATLGVAFVARPVGSILFGHFGDRIGRKTTLIITLLMMGIATVLVGLVPTTAAIGIAAPIALVVLRLIQGLAAGGEWAGAALFSAEHAPKEQRGKWAVMASFGGGLAIMLANATFLITGLGMSDDAFLSWGWRIPFLFSIVMVAVGLYIRLRLEETPVFNAARARGITSNVPFFDAFRRQPRQMLLASGVALTGFTFAYLGATYLANYGTSTLQLPRSAVLGIGIVGGAAHASGLLLGGVFSDRIGRRRWTIYVGVVAVVWALLLFPILDTRSTVGFAIAIPVTQLLAGSAFGPLGALLSEVFQTRFRYTAVGFCYNIAGILGGAIPPIIGAAVTAAYGGFAFGLIVAAFCLVSLVCVVALGETRGYDLDRHDRADASA